MDSATVKAAYQPSFDDLGTPLFMVDFCVVDLETTGTNSSAGITEIGAVRIRGGETVGEFSTLVNPDEHIPASIQLLTGITNEMVADAPSLSAVLPSFLEFAHGCVLVAHNASFDVGFLKRACASLDYEWPDFKVVDTLKLARQSLTRDEVRNCRLSTLANFFKVETSPTHRALEDAKATTEVFYGVLERLGSFGVSTLEDLAEFTHRVSPERRAKRKWTENIPRSPGVYWFYSDHPESLDDQGNPKRQVLYVGKSVDLYTRTRSYFTASEKRHRMEELIRVSSGLDFVVCSTPLEAEVRELRIIQAHSPRYNRRSKRQDKVLWVKVTNEPVPRLSIVRSVADDGCTYWGPFPSKQLAEESCAAIYESFPIRQCTRRLSVKTPSSSCVLAQMDRCLAPCLLEGRRDDYFQVVEQVKRVITNDVRPVLTGIGSQLSRLVEEQRFEEAAQITSRLTTFQRASIRSNRLKSLVGCPEIVAAKKSEDTWLIEIVRFGKLTGSARATPGQDPQQVAARAKELAEVVKPPVAGLPAGSVEEAERIAAWLETPGVRIIDIDGDWSWPLFTCVGDEMLPKVLLNHSN